MNATTRLTRTYERGDEIVVLLEEARVYNVERGVLVEGACLPCWTIGIVLDGRTQDGSDEYVLRIEHDGCVCLCTVREDAIEGMA